MSAIGRSLHQCGFTLVELLVVLTILGLVLNAAPAVISRLDGGLRLRSTAMQLVTDIRGVHAAAISQQQEQRLQFDLPRHRYRSDNSGADRSVPTDIDIQLQTTEIGAFDASRASIRFFPDGSSTGGEIALSAKNRRMIVSVAWLTGRVSISE